jgi:acetylornithine/N-succinyldiaminopimelate aminotransferase
MMAVEFDSFEFNKQLIDHLIEEGVFTDWFLFAPHALRIAPPLNISDEAIREACSKIIAVLNQIH